MDEYYCPNCNATLNEQPGFDPDSGVWTCTSCGQQLMGDDIYDGDTYQGVAWYCDSCGALLNKQSGFSDSYGSWTCTECYHVNGTTADDIYSSRSEYEHEHEQEHPFMSAIINGLTTGIVEGVSSIFDERKSQGDDDDEDSFSSYTPSYPTKESIAREAEQERIKEQAAEQEQKRRFEKRLHNKRVKAFMLKKKRIPVGHSSQDLLKLNVLKVSELLHNSAFKNAVVTPLKDIYVGSSKSEGEVEQIVIDGNTHFMAYDEFPYDAKITITYHEKREINLPFATKTMRKKSYSEVIELFQNLGFTQIRLKPIKDITTGWIKKDGSVERVIISGSPDTPKNAALKYDVDIAIEYHAYRRSK